MFTIHSFPLISTWDECLNKHWFHHSQTLFQNSALSDEHKSLWRWLATTQESANEFTIRCSHSYEQLSIAMNKSVEEIHSLLFTLKLMGFLRASLPLLITIEQKLTIPMILEVRKISLCMPSKIFLNEKHAQTVMSAGINLHFSAILAC